MVVVLPSTRTFTRRARAGAASVPASRATPARTMSRRNTNPPSARGSGLCGGAEGLLTRGSPLRHLPGLAASGLRRRSNSPHSGGTVPDSHRLPLPRAVARPYHAQRRTSGGATRVRESPAVEPEDAHAGEAGMGSLSASQATPSRVPFGRAYHGQMPSSRALSLWLPVILWAAVIFT